MEENIHYLVFSINQAIILASSDVLGMMKILAECPDLFPERFLAAEFFPHRLEPSARQYSTKPFKANGTASVVVEYEGLEGSEAIVVLINQKGELAAQPATIVAGGSK